MELQLNFNKPGNYAFFCPVSKVHLTRSNPVAIVNEVTPYIKRGLKSEAILDVTDKKAGQKAESEPKKPQEPLVEAPPAPEPNESMLSEELTEPEAVNIPQQTNIEVPTPTSEDQPKKRGRKAK